MVSPEQKAARLLDIVNEVDSIRAFVEVADMATADLLAEHRDPLSELLQLISSRLRDVSADLASAKSEQAA